MKSPRLGIALTTGALTLGLAACGGTPDNTGTVTATLPAPTSSSTSLAADENNGLCEDITGDGKGIDISKVFMAKNGGLLAVNWTLSAPIPQGTSSYIIVISSLDGSKSGQLGLKYQNGTKISHYVWDGRSENVTTPAWADGFKVMSGFPINSVEKFGNPFKWSAVVTHEGNDVDVCPSPGPDPLKPNTFLFSY